MTEEDARAWVEREYDVPRETMARLDAFCAFLREENARQNLVSSASLDGLWQRHIADSAQLLGFAPEAAPWIDLGTGAGFPGLIVAALRGGPVTLVEERRLRVDFLRRAAEILAAAPDILAGKAERLPPRPFAVISARAFAPLDRLFEAGLRFSTEKTLWILPKGRNAQSELEAVAATWQGDFRLHDSRTDKEAKIVTATGVRRRAKR